MINKLDLLWLPNLIVLGIYFILGTKFSWNERIDTCIWFCFWYFGFLGGYLVVTARYLGLLLVTTHYLVVTARSCSSPLLVWTANSQENHCARISFQISCSSKKETVAQVFFCEYCKTFKNNFFIAQLR